MKMIDRAKELIKERDFDKLDDFWTDLIMEKDIGLDRYFDVADTLRDAGETSRALLLLEILGEHYESQRDYECAVETQKHILRYLPENPTTREEIIRLYKTRHADSQHLDEYLEFSGLSKGEPILKAIARFEEFLKFDVGNYFYFERYGMGEVVDVKPIRREIVVDFEKKKKHFLTIEVAKGLLLPINESHFLYKKFKNIDELRSVAMSQPLDLVVMLLKNLRESLSASRIKGYLNGIVPDEELIRLWERVRKTLEKHDNIRVAGKTAKVYTYVESATDKQDQAIDAFHKASIREKYLLAEEYAKKLKTVFDILAPHIEQMGNQMQKTHPGIALDILMLYEEIGKPEALQYSIDDILAVSLPEEIMTDMANHEHQTRLLSIIKNKYPDEWINSTTSIVFKSGDSRLLDSAADHLKNAPGTLTDIYYKIFAMPKQYPKQFQWMLKRIETGVLREYLQPGLIPRLIDSLDYVRGVKSTVKNILSLDNFDRMIGQAAEKDALRIRESVERSATFTGYEKKNFLRILEHHFPQFFEKKSDIIYSTATALKRRKEQLNHILTVEIPENKKDISRAREFGDLSENFEYKAAKERQDQLYQKVKTIESELQITHLIDASKIKTDRVDVGTIITLENPKDESRIVYTILGRWDTDLERSVISNEAPLALAMMGRKCGDVVEIDGLEHKIIRIDRAL
jgi:transcription elongation factor GreA